jgi:hypothetical protein
MFLYGRRAAHALADMFLCRRRAAHALADMFLCRRRAAHALADMFLCRRRAAHALADMFLCRRRAAHALADMFLCGRRAAHGLADISILIAETRCERRMDAALGSAWRQRARSISFFWLLVRRGYIVACLRIRNARERSGFDQDCRLSRQTSVVRKRDIWRQTPTSAAALAL